MSFWAGNRPSNLATLAKRRNNIQAVSPASNSTSTVNAPDAAKQTHHVKLFTYNPLLGVYKMISCAGQLVWSCFPVRFIVSFYLFFSVMRSASLSLTAYCSGHVATSQIINKVFVS